MCAIYQNHLTLRNVTTLTVFGMRYKLHLNLPIMKCYIYPPVTARLLYPHFLTSVVFTQHTALNLKLGLTSMAK